MYNGAEYYWQGKNIGFNFFTAVPFGMTANELNAWIDHGGGQVVTIFNLLIFFDRAGVDRVLANNKDDPPPSRKSLRPNFLFSFVINFVLNFN